MDKPKIKKIREVLRKLFADNKELFDEIGVQISQGNASYSSTSADIKVKVCDVSESGVVETAERTAYREMCELYDMKPEWLDQEFEAQGKVYKVVGLKTKSRKYPVLVEEVDTGKCYKFTDKGVIQAMRIKEASKPAPKKSKPAEKKVTKPAEKSGEDILNNILEGINGK